MTRRGLPRSQRSMTEAQQEYKKMCAHSGIRPHILLFPHHLFGSDYFNIRSKWIDPHDITSSPSSSGTTLANVSCRI